MATKSSPEHVGNNEKINPKLEKKLGGVTGKGFMPGKSGNPTGRPLKKPITEMYERIMSDPALVDAFEASIVKLLLKGNMATVLQLREVTDRLEGKITQPIEADISVNLADAIAAARKRAGK